MREILVGRDEEDTKLFGLKNSAFIAKHYVKTGDTINLSNQILLDLARPHVILVCGKRGSGKSYTMGTIAEEIAFLPEKMREKMAVVIFDTMGIYWTMKYQNRKEAHLLEEWGLEPKGIDANIVVPFGYAESYAKAGVPVDTPFALKPSELTINDFAALFSLEQFSPPLVLLERAIKTLYERRKDYTIDELISAVRATEGEEPVKLGLVNRLLAANEWGLFHERGTPLADVIKPGKINVIDVSVYGSSVGGWSVRSLIIGLIVKKTFAARMLARRVEETEAIRSAEHPLLHSQIAETDIPMTWFFIDEAHEVLPLHGSTPATEPLLQLIREGRQPGLSLVVATQRPGKIHSDLMSQADIVIAHHVTSLPDINALNSIMATYMARTLERYLSALPKVKGAAILLDDNSEKIYAVRVRPRLSWHGGESASLKE